MQKYNFHITELTFLLIAPADHYESYFEISEFWLNYVSFLKLDVLLQVDQTKFHIVW